MLLIFTLHTNLMFGLENVFLLVIFSNKKHINYMILIPNKFLQVQMSHFMSIFFPITKPNLNQTLSISSNTNQPNHFPNSAPMPIIAPPSTFNSPTPNVSHACCTCWLFHWPSWSVPCCIHWSVHCSWSYCYKWSEHCWCFFSSTFVPF